MSSRRANHDERHGTTSRIFSVLAPSAARGPESTQAATLTTCRQFLNGL